VRRAKFAVLSIESSLVPNMGEFEPPTFGAATVAAVDNLIHSSGELANKFGK